MNDKELYTKILGIESPWEIKELQLALEKGQIDIEVGLQAGTEPICPLCETEGKQRICKIHDRRVERIWRHLDTCQYKTYIHCRIPRVKCPEHGVLSMEVSWAEGQSRFSLLFESYAIHLLQASQNRSKSAEILRISWDEMDGIMRRGVDRRLSRRDSTLPSTSMSPLSKYEDRSTDA